MNMRKPFDPKDGEFAKNIRSTTDDDDTELRSSMKQFGWIKQFPALVDEYGVVIVGHRRSKIAKQLKIESVIKKLTLGNGDAADAERFKLAIASNVGHKAMTKDDRKRIAEYLYGKREWTMERIAEALNVTQKTVSKDLTGFYTEGIKSRRSEKRGRPKGSNAKTREPRRRNPAITPVAEEVLARSILDDGKTLEAASKEAGLGSVQVAKVAVARELGRREAQGQIDPSTLSMTAQDKLAAAIRQAKRKLAIEFEERVRAESRKRIEQTILPSYIKDHALYKEIIRARKGVMDRSTYKKILSSLHPDRVTDQSLKKRYEDAFYQFNRLEKLLLDENESPTPLMQMPRTYDELMAMKRRVTEQRKAKRAMAHRH